MSAELKLRAERKAGEMLRAMPKAVNRHSPSEDTLSSLEIHPKQSMRWQQVAAVPEPEFERHLTTGQAALVALDLLPMLEDAAKERKGTRSDLCADLPHLSPAKSRDQAAKMVGTSGRAVGQAKRVATVSA